MTNFPDHPFWDFSVGVYGAPGVAPACLALQDRYDLDVNLLLLCCWFGRSRAAVPSRDEMRRLSEAVAAWHRNVVRPLRGVRRWLKVGGPTVPTAQREPLRQEIKRLELEAEHIEQLALAAALGPDVAGQPPAAPEHATTALAYYFEIIGISPDETDRRHLTLLLGAAFPETPSDRLATLLANAP
jgi:uncharacterized protein (TIGR02444 family)